MKKHSNMSMVVIFFVLVCMNALVPIEVKSAEENPMASKNFYGPIKIWNENEAGDSQDTLFQGLMMGLFTTWGWCEWYSNPPSFDLFMLLIQEELDNNPEKMEHDIFKVSFEALNSHNYIGEIGQKAIAAKITRELFREHKAEESE